MFQSKTQDQSKDQKKMTHYKIIHHKNIDIKHFQMLSSYRQCKSGATVSVSNRCSLFQCIFKCLRSVGSVKVLRCSISFHMDFLLSRAKSSWRNAAVCQNEGLPLVTKWKHQDSGQTNRKAERRFPAGKTKHAQGANGVLEHMGGKQANFGDRMRGRQRHGGE